jgi:hypothetical protein
MTPTTLSLARRGDQIVRGGLGRFVDSNLDDGLVLLTGGLHRAAWAGVPVRGALAADGAWRAEATKPIGGGRWRLHASGRWDASSGHGEVWRVEIANQTDGGATTGQVIESSGWAMVPGFPRPVAGRSLTRRLDGVADRRVVLGSLGRVSGRDFDLVTRVPPLAGSDEYRGPVTFREEYDHTEGEVRVAGAEGEGWIARHPLPTARAAVDDEDRSRLRIAGWVLAGLMLSFLVWLRIRGKR